MYPFVYLKIEVMNVSAYMCVKFLQKCGADAGMGPPSWGSSVVKDQASKWGVCIICRPN